MKKLLFAIATSALFTLPTLAQEKVQKGTKPGDNWYIQLQGGASYTFSESYKDASVKDLISPSVGVAIGKDFTPVFGLRVFASGWESKSQYTWQDETYSHKFIQGGVDGTINLTNALMKYNKDRVFNLKGIAGFGLLHGKQKEGLNINNDGKQLKKSNMIVPRIGLQADFLVANNLSLNLEVMGNLLEDRFNGNSSGKAYDGMISAMAGLTFHFNNRGFNFVNYIDQSQVDALNNRINEQRAVMGAKDSKIAQLEDALAQKPEVIVKETPVEVSEVIMNAVVVFKIGRSDLQENQEINILNAAKFFQDHPDYDCVITGYADKATGNAKLNQKLSERRADAVAKILIEKFGIDAKRVKTEGNGDKEQPFQIGAWNRVAIFKAVKAMN